MTKPSRHEKPGLLKRKPHLPYVMPAMLVLGALTILPTIFLWVVSLTNYNLGWTFSQAEFVGLKNYIHLFSGADPDFWHSICISVLFMVLATGIEMLLGFWIAMLLNSTEFRLKALVISILIIPIAMTPSIAGNIWKLMYNAEYGIINHVLDTLFGLKITWLSPQMAFFSVLIADIWMGTPFVTLIFYAGMRSLPQDPYESAAIDGANAYHMLRYITLPSLRPLIFLALVFRAIDTLKTYDLPFVLTQGGPGNATEFLSLHIYRLANAQNGLIARAAATAIVLLVIVSVVSNLLIRQQRKGV